MHLPLLLLHLCLESQILFNQRWFVHHRFDVLLILRISKDLSLLDYLQLLASKLRPIGVLRSRKHPLPLCLLLGHLLLFDCFSYGLKFSLGLCDQLVNRWLSHHLGMSLRLVKCLLIIRQSTTFLVRYIPRDSGEYPRFYHFVVTSCGVLGFLVLQLSADVGEHCCSLIG